MHLLIFMVATCPLSDKSLIVDVPKVIMVSMMALLDVPGVMVLTEEDPKVCYLFYLHKGCKILYISSMISSPKYYLMMKNGRKYIKTTPDPSTEKLGATNINDQSRLSSVVKVDFCMANSNIKKLMFLDEPERAKIIHAKNNKTISELKRHLEKHATATDQMVSCPMRGSNRVYEGYLDMQNLD